jgi:predicted RNA-binding protein YlqC (UPF0109 family)
MMTLHLQVPSGSAGSIIGKQGDVIKAIREQSRARVIVGDSVPGAEERDVTVKVRCEIPFRVVEYLFLGIFFVRLSFWKHNQHLGNLRRYRASDEYDYREHCSKSKPSVFLRARRRFGDFDQTSCCQ